MASPSLTPQRKHRKLLKDGSGSEVWPESLERIFVQGLREYWNSPWATYTRGRSRWRNQFLVEHLQKAGHLRTKKQVASHIQVLRNMWKTDPAAHPEYFLVAGPEDLPPDVKLEHLDSSGLISIRDLDDADTNSSTSSPLDIAHDFPPSPAQPLNPPLLNYSPSTHLAFPSAVLPTCDSPSSTPVDHGPSSLPSTAHLGPSAHPFSPAAVLPNQKLRHPNLVNTTSWSPNRVTAVSFYTDEIVPLDVNLDALMPPHPPARTPPAILRLRLAVPLVTDTTSSNFHGFAVTLSLDHIWSASARCTTRVYTNRQCTYAESDAVQIQRIQVGNAICKLPDSQLGRCRWLDASLPTCLTQEVVVDNEIVLIIVYDLDRRSSVPAAQVLLYQRHSATANSSTQTQTSQPSYHNPTSHSNVYSQPSHSYALMPVDPSASLFRQSTHAPASF